MISLFKYFLSRPTDSDSEIKKRKAFGLFFTTEFPDTEFEPEDAIMYHAVKYLVNDLGVNITERYLSIYLDTELRNLILTKKFIPRRIQNKNLKDVFNVDKIVEDTSTIIWESYYSLIAEDCNVEEFQADLVEWMMNNLNTRLENVCNESIDMMTDIVHKRVGSMEALKYMNIQSLKLQKVYDLKKVNKIKSIDPDADRETLKHICDTMIDAVNKDSGGIYATHMWCIEAGPGMGKTRFLIGCILYPAIIKFKRNVLFRALEQEKAEIESMFIARHIYTLFKGAIVSDKMVMTKKDTNGKPLPDNILKMIEAARQDFFSGRYGKLFVDDSDMFLESIEADLDLTDNLEGPFDLIAIDNIPLIKQMESDGAVYIKQLMDWEIIKRAFRKFKSYIRTKKDKAIIVVNQSNDEGIKAGKQGKSSNKGAGGLEGRQSSDYVLELNATEIQEENEQRTLHNPKKRSTKGLGKILLACKLACCLMLQIRDKELIKKDA